MADCLIIHSQANVMLEYDIGDASKLLTKNIETAKASLNDVENDLNFLRDQITTSEVSILFIKLQLLDCIYHLWSKAS